MILIYFSGCNAKVSLKLKALVKLNKCCKSWYVFKSVKGSNLACFIQHIKQTKELM